MIAAQLRPRIALAIVLLATALVLFGTRSHAVHAQGSTDNVRDIDLAKMGLPLSAFGPDYAAFELDPTSGFEPEADRDPREVNAYFISYISPAEDNSFNASFAGSAAGLFSSSSNAADFVSDALLEFQTAFDDLGGVYSTFPVVELPGAFGFQATLSEPDFNLVFQITGVIFPHDRLVGEVIFARLDDTNVQADAISAATALDQRMKGVLTGKVTDFPAPLPPDVNCDGSLDAIDASLVLQLGAGLVASLPCDALADANQDGRTNAIDASLILQYSAGLIDRLPV